MNNKSRSFTLIEMIMAFTLFSVVAAGIYSSLNSGVKLYAQGNRIIEENQKLRIFFDTIAVDLHNAVNYEPYLESAWQSGQIVFPARVGVFGQEEADSQLVKLNYFLDEGRLIRRAAGLAEGFDQEKAEKEVLLEGVKELNFEYAYQSLTFGSEYQWLNNWTKPQDKPNLPKGVKIKIKLDSGDLGTAKIFTKTVFIPLGELGSQISG